MLTRLFNLGFFDEATDIYINWDGARDNANYTCLYTLCHFLVAAEEMGWPLRTITVLRLQVSDPAPNPSPRQ